MGATLTELRRTYASGIDITDCVPLEKIDSSNIQGFILNEEEAVSHLREIKASEKQALRFCNGGQLSFERIHCENIKENELFRVKFAEKLLGIGFADLEKNQIGIKCILNYL